MKQEQRCYDRAIVKKLFYKLKKMSVTVATKKKKQHAGTKRRSLPISHSITKSDTPSINSSIQQFTVKKTYHALLRFCPPHAQFPTGYLFSLIWSPIALSFFLQGMGVPLLLDVIRIVKPTHIVQFNYATKENANKNLPKMTAELFASTPGWAFTVEEEERPENNSRLLKQISMALCLTFLWEKAP